MCTGWAQLVPTWSLLSMSHSSQVPLIMQCCGTFASKTRLLILNNRGFDPTGSRLKFHSNVVSGSQIGGNVQSGSGMAGVSCGNQVSRFTTSNRMMTLPMLRPGGNPGGFVFPEPVSLTFWLLPGPKSPRYRKEPGAYFPK